MSLSRWQKLIATRTGRTVSLPLRARSRSRRAEDVAMGARNLGDDRMGGRDREGAPREGLSRTAPADPRVFGRAPARTWDAMWQAGNGPRAGIFTHPEASCP